MPEQRRTNHGNGKYRDMPLELAHVQPQATEMERAVLGALMIDRDAYMEVCNLLRVESFYEPRNQMVYEAIVKLNAEDSPVDVLTVTDKLGKMGKLDDVGGPGYIADLSSRVATSANIVYHANVVAEKYLARQMIRYVGTIGNRPPTEGGEIIGSKINADGGNMIFSPDEYDPFKLAAMNGYRGSD